MSASGMHPTGERHVATQVEMMVWCNRMDLLALSNTRGEVQLHRLNWQRVWCLPPPQETSTVRGMAWRPDGKILGVGYSCGRFSLVDVEDKEIVFSSGAPASDTAESPHGSVTCLSWVQRSTSATLHHVPYRNHDDASAFLPPPPSLSSNYKKSDETSADFKQSKAQTELNILMVGYEDGQFHMNAFGVVPCGIIDLKKYFRNQPQNLKIVDAQLSDDFTLLQIFIQNSKDNRLKLLLLNTEVLAAYSEELHALSNKYGQIKGLVLYIEQTIISITEAWETILLEMDSKLEKYASKVMEGGVSADFLDLLMLGVPSDELEIFLLTDLTAKGLKKFGTSIEFCYSTIQKLILKQLNTTGHNITYHLAELRGLARITHRYQILGLEEETVTKAILSSTAFINKCLELQQVIDHSMKNYKAFFRWLYVVIVRLMDEHVPAEIVKITQQDLIYIAEFLQNFDKVGIENPEGSTVGGEKRSGKFNLEKLGQYLVNKELTITPDDDENPWIQFLKENPCLVENPCMMRSFKKFSLVQQQDHLKTSIQNVFNCSEKSLATEFSLLNIIDCLPCEIAVDGLITSSLRVTQINVPQDNSILVAITDSKSSEKGFYFAQISMKNDVAVAKCCYFYFHACGNLNDSKLDAIDGNYLRVVDVHFYSSEYLSILLEQPEESEEMSVFVQFPVKIGQDHCKEVVLEKGQGIDTMRDMTKVNAFSVMESGSCKILDKISAWRIAVSGGRKVAVVLSKTCRKVHLFEMEGDGEEDEDETLDTTPQ